MGTNVPSVNSMCDSVPQQTQHKGNKLCFEGQNRTSVKVEISKANDYGTFSWHHNTDKTM